MVQLRCCLLLSCLIAFSSFIRSMIVNCSSPIEVNTRSVATKELFNLLRGDIDKNLLKANRWRGRARNQTYSPPAKQISSRTISHFTTELLFRELVRNINKFINYNGLSHKLLLHFYYRAPRSVFEFDCDSISDADRMFVENCEEKTQAGNRIMNKTVQLINKLSCSFCERAPRK
jgi:hypothetical protein